MPNSRPVPQTLEVIERRRLAIAQEMLAIRSMERGSISEQFMPVSRTRKKDTGPYGPYYVLARWEGKKTVSRRLKSQEDLNQARGDVDAYIRFEALCREFEDLTRQLGKLEREAPREDLIKKSPHRGRTEPGDSASDRNRSTRAPSGPGGR